MKLFLAVTDNAWFTYLSRLRPDEINFWQPGGRTSFAAIEPGAPFLFKLHSPLNYIVGGGFFVRHSFLPLSLAWEAFEKKNGAEDLTGFSAAVRKYRSRKGAAEKELDPVIGCIILASPFFFEKDDWIPVPADWSANIVSGKTYNTQDVTGRLLWDQVQQRLGKVPIEGVAESDGLPLEGPSGPRYGAEYLTRPRLGQGAFRVVVTEAYQRRCAMTGEKTLPVLNASHIKPYAQEGPHETSNGLLLREDIHTLYDLGYLTVTRDYTIEVSSRIKQDYGNGRDYYAMHGRKLVVLPEKAGERPSREFIEWHNERVYVG